MYQSLTVLLIIDIVRARLERAPHLQDVWFKSRISLSQTVKSVIGLIRHMAVIICIRTLGVRVSKLIVR